MRYLYKILVPLLILTGCKKENASKETSIIEGVTSVDFNNKEIYLQYIHNDSLVTKTIQVESDGKFQIELENIKAPTEAILTNDTTNYTPKVKSKNIFRNYFLFQFGSNSVPVRFRKKIDTKMFLLDKGHIKINISDSIYNCSIYNSLINKELQKLHRSLNSAMKKYNEHQNSGINTTQVKDTRIIDSLENAYSKIWLERQEAYRKYIVENPDSEISLFALKYIYYGVNNDVIRLYESLNDSVKANDFGNIRKGITNYLKRMDKRLSIDKIVPNFKLTNVKKETVALYDIKSKYILLDFWASWCGPCRKENKLIKKYYDDFDKLDFEIVSISVDDDELKWKNAIKEDKINWVSLWDNKKKINDQFGIVSYPTNFLLNKDFKIVEANINAGKLKEKLTELLN